MSDDDKESRLEKFKRKAKEKMVKLRPTTTDDWAANFDISYGAYCNARGDEEKLSEDEFTTQLADMAGRIRERFYAPPSEAFCKAEAFLSLCKGEDSPMLTANTFDRINAMREKGEL